jgi:hypothetical protein
MAQQLIINRKADAMVAHPQKREEEAAKTRRAENGQTA